MKKFLALFLILVMSILIVGCVSEEREVRHTDKPEYNEIEVADSKSEEGNGKDTVREDGTGIKDSALEEQDKNRKERIEKRKEPEKELDPKFEHIYEIYEKYRDVLAKGNHLFTISDKITKSKATGSFYYLSIRNKKGTEAEISFYIEEDGTICKSFEAGFFESFGKEAMEDFITVTFQAFDPEMNEEMAEKKMREIVDSYNGTISNSIKVGDYGIVIEDSTFLAECTSIYVMHSSEVNEEIDKEEYDTYSAEEMIDSVNNGKKAKLVATPFSYTLPINNIYSFGKIGSQEMMAADEEGKRCYIYYYFHDFLMDFELGKTYTFYGIIVHDWDGMPHLRIEHYEE